MMICNYSYHFACLSDCALQSSSQHLLLSSFLFSLLRTARSRPSPPTRGDSLLLPLLPLSLHLLQRNTRKFIQQFCRCCQLYLMSIYIHTILCTAFLTSYLYQQQTSQITIEQHLFLFTCILCRSSQRDNLIIA